MRLSSVLSTRDLPPAELQAGVLDGELVRVGDAYCAIDTVIGSAHRAASIAAEVPAWAIAEQFTAAWVYGIVDRQPRMLQLCVSSSTKVRPLSTPRCSYREVVIDESDTITVGDLAVTTPLRTAFDIARTAQRFPETTGSILRALAVLGDGFSLDDCLTALDERRNLPHKRVALARLTAALGSTAAATPDQPALTRYTSYT